MEIKHRTVSSREAWAEALDRGVESGLKEGADHVRDEAQRALAARVDPWGAAFAPLSPTTIKLYAETGFVEALPSRSQNIGVRRKGVRHFGIRVTGPRALQRVAFIQQFGNPNNRMFNNAEPAPIPARPALPVRPSGAVDLPPETERAIYEAVRQGIAQAFERQTRAERRG